MVGHTVCFCTAIMHWWHTCFQSDGPLALRVVVSWRQMMLVLVRGFHFPGLKTVEEGKNGSAVSWCGNANKHTSSYLHWVWHIQGHACQSYPPHVLAHLQTGTHRWCYSALKWQRVDTGVVCNHNNLANQLWPNANSHNKVLTEQLLVQSVKRVQNFLLFQR